MWHAAKFYFILRMSLVVPHYQCPYLHPNKYWPLQKWIIALLQEVPLPFQVGNPLLKLRNRWLYKIAKNKTWNKSAKTCNNSNCTSPRACSESVAELSWPSSVSTRCFSCFSCSLRSSTFSSSATWLSFKDLWPYIIFILRSCQCLYDYKEKADNKET